MTSTYVSERLLQIHTSLQIVHARGAGLPAEAMPPLLKALLTAVYITQELEEDFALAERRIAELLRQMKAGRQPVDIDQEGNVVRLSFRPRIIRTVNPEGGDAA